MTPQASFLDMLDASFRQAGIATGLPAPFRAAVEAVPRDRFVHRFRIADGPLQDRDADPETTLPLIYSDAVMRHVDAAGDLLPSSNSQPSYILFLLHLLELAPGQRVLEIGSGSGWLAAIMAHLVGPSGHVTGIELLADLAAQSRTDLAALGVPNVEIVTGDGALGHEANAPFDAAIITAATWDLPLALFDQVADGGRLLVPVELRSEGCAVTLLRRRGPAFVAERAVPGWFVPLQGDQQTRPTATLDPPAGGETFALPLALAGPDGPMHAAAQFRAFLARTETGFVRARQPDPALAAFGIEDPEDGSLALWHRGQIIRHRGRGAAQRLARAYANWADLGMPGLSAYHLEIHRTAAAPRPAERQWLEPRTDTTLLWRLDAPSWQTLR